MKVVFFFDAVFEVDVVQAVEPRDQLTKHKLEMTWANKNVRHEQSRYKVTQGEGGLFLKF